MIYYYDSSRLGIFFRALVAVGAVFLAAAAHAFSLQSAIDAAREGDTITLREDAVCDRALAIGKAVTIDLAGHCLTGTQGDFFRLTAPKTVTLRNGTYRHTAPGKAAFCPNAPGAVVNVQDCVVETPHCCVWSPAAGTVNFARCVIVDAFFLGNTGRARANLNDGTCVFNRTCRWSEDVRLPQSVYRRIGFFNAQSNSGAPTAGDDAPAPARTDYGRIEPAQFDLQKVEPLSAVTAAALPREGTNTVPLRGTSALDVIRAGAAAFFGTVKVTDGHFAFSISGDGRLLWSSGLLQAGESATFEVDVRAAGIVTFATWGDGAGAWERLAYACNAKMWQGGDDLRGLTPLATYRAATLARNPPWENPAVYAVNRCAQHAPVFAYDSVEAARAARSREDSPYFLSLDGPWRVRWAPAPAQAPEGFERPDCAVDDWPAVNVPDSLECAGFGTAIFRNVGYYWTADPPFVSRPAPTNFLVHAEPNGTASYRRAFDLPASWAGRDTFLRFDGFASAIDVWVNGRKVGYAEDGRQGAEFDVTPFVRPGANTLAVRTYRLSDGSYMEDQDFYRLSGLIRPVYLRSEPKRRLRDFTVRTLRASAREPYRGGTWLVKVDAAIPADCSVELALFGADGARVPASVVAASPHLALRVAGPKLWSAEEPNLYRLVVSLRDAAGRLLECVPQNVGFREIVREHAQLLLNGQPILFKGVNRHEMDIDHGYAVPYPRMVEDVKLMKRNNVNAVRLSHYANDPRWYDLADAYGLYLVDEANLETHGSSHHGWRNHGRRMNPLLRVTGGARNPVVDPRFRAAALDRDRGMVLRDKNHPSVVIWSLGNENFVAWSDFFPEAAELVHALDPTRPIMNQYNGRKDMVDSMYARVRSLVDYGRRTDTTLPFVICEYSHAAGNSCGNFKDYWDAINTYRTLQGGFIWEWADQGLRAEIPMAETRTPRATGRYWAHAANGIVTSDRQPTPQLPEVKYFYQTANVLPVDPPRGVFAVTNRAFFANLDRYVCDWTLEDDGRVVASGTLGRLNVPPQGGLRVALAPVAAREGVAVRTWNFSFKTPVALPYAEAGHEFARDQIVVFDRAAERGAPPVAGRAEVVEETDDCVSVRAGDAAWRVSKKTGALVSWRVKGEERLAAPLEPNFWRAPTSNARGAGLPGRQKAWKTAAAHRRVRTVRVVREPAAQVTVELAFPDAAETTGTLAYAFGDGACRVAFELRPHGQGLADPPRVGLTCRIARAYERVSWFGRGPHEAYSDRAASAFLGRHAAPADELFFAYAQPQENGNRMATRELTLAADDGRAITVRGCPKFDFSLQPCTAAALEEGWNPHYGKPDAARTLNLDYGHMGVAGESSWGASADPWPAHHLRTGDGVTLRLAVELK